jgi:hypothetical protein
LAVGEGNECVLPAVQEQDRDGDVSHIESPWADQAVAVVPPALTARRECLALGADDEFGQFTSQDGCVRGWQEGCPLLGQAAGR